MTEQTKTALIIMIPISIFIIWYSHNANKALSNYAKEQYTQCLNQTLDSPQAQQNCELINPLNK